MQVLHKINYKESLCHTKWQDFAILAYNIIWNKI